jgi:hypothetical protein
MAWLRAVRDVDPPNWVIGAGAIRNLVWDRLHAFENPSPLKDIDVCYFDPDDLSKPTEEKYERALNNLMPLPWEVKNQASVHLWYERKFGVKVEPFESVEEAVATWPETCTAVAVRLLEDGALEVIAPFGLDDLFEMVVRRNPSRVTPDQFLDRLKAKRIQELWPKVRVIIE